MNFKERVNKNPSLNNKAVNSLMSSIRYAEKHPRVIEDADSCWIQEMEEYPTLQINEQHFEGEMIA